MFVLVFQLVTQVLSPEIQRHNNLPCNSQISCTLSTQFEHYFTGEEGDPSSSTDRAAKTQLSPKAVAAGVAPALAVAWGARQGGEVLDLLNVMGGFLVPLLYFALPAVLLLRVGEGGKREE